MSLEQALQDAVASKPRVVIVHGIYTNEGNSNIRTLQPTLEAAGFEVVIFKYGFITALMTYFLNPGLARRLAELVRPDDHLVCHSNGATIAWLGMKNYGMRCLKVSLIAPALDTNKIMTGAMWTDVYHNRCDDVVLMSRLFIRHAWGAMGRDGCTNADGLRMGMRNINVADHAGLPQICGHLQYFVPHILPRFAPWLVRQHLERL